MNDLSAFNTDGNYKGSRGSRHHTNRENWYDWDPETHDDWLLCDSAVICAHGT